ncbi:MAG UNVERIFIED_CONTAM: TfoX/Sxy family protein [Planctomycetaceae bacterium]
MFSFAQEILEPFGPLKIRAMFGGYGIYKDGIIFAIIGYNELYFKADKVLAEYFKSQGSEPFTYDMNGKTASMSYYKVLPEILEDPDLLKEWFELSYQVATKSKKPLA